MSRLADDQLLACFELTAGDSKRGYMVNVARKIEQLTLEHHAPEILELRDLVIHGDATITRLRARLDALQAQLIPPAIERP